MLLKHFQILYQHFGNLYKISPMVLKNYIHRLSIHIHDKNHKITRFLCVLYINILFYIVELVYVKMSKLLFLSFLKNYL